jgi:hypothetical protein
MSERAEQMSNAPVRGVPHAETFTSSRDGATIAVACDCAVGVDHPYRRVFTA